MVDMLSSVLTVALGVVVGTLLTWIISYYMAKKILPKLLKSLSNNPEVIRLIQKLRENSKKEKTEGREEQNVQ